MNLDKPREAFYKKDELYVKKNKKNKNHPFATGSKM